MHRAVQLLQLNQHTKSSSTQNLSFPVWPFGNLFWILITFIKCLFSHFHLTFFQLFVFCLTQRAGSKTSDGHIWVENSTHLWTSSHLLFVIKALVVTLLNLNQLWYDVFICLLSFGQVIVRMTSLVLSFSFRMLSLVAIKWKHSVKNCAYSAT